MVFLTEYAFFRGKRKRPFAVMALFALSVAIIPLSDLEVHWGERAGDPEWKTLGTDVYTRGQYFATQMRVIMTYLRLLVLPVAQNIDYDYRVSGSILDPDAFLAALVHAGLIAAAIFLLRKGGRLMLAGFGILWFYIALSVESSVVPIAEIIAEYRLYLPSFGAVLTLSALTVSFFNLRRRGIWLAAFGALALVSFGAATFSRNFVWASERSLWTDAVKKSPNRMRPWINYAGTLGAAERVKIYEWVLSRDPGNRDALDFLAQAYIEMGMLDEAREILLGSERIGRRAENMSYLANYYIKRNENAEALFYLRKIMEMEPGDSGHHYRAGVALRGLGRVDEAEKAFREALRLDPSNVDALNDLGNLLAEKGRLGQSLEFLEKAARLKPGAASVWTNLGVTYAQMNDYDEALRALDKAITLNPKLPDPWFNKGVILWGAGRREAAVFALRKALSIDPNYQKARDQLRQWEGG
jgi:tetratricopeptide (TPR) repeat protein